LKFLNDLTTSKVCYIIYKRINKTKKSNFLSSLPTFDISDISVPYNISYYPENVKNYYTYFDKKIDSNLLLKHNINYFYFIRTNSRRGSIAKVMTFFNSSTKLLKGFHINFKKYMESFNLAEILNNKAKGIDSIFNTAYNLSNLIDFILTINKPTFNLVRNKNRKHSSSRVAVINSNKRINVLFFWIKNLINRDLNRSVVFRIYNVLFNTICLEESKINIIKKSICDKLFQTK